MSESKALEAAGGQVPPEFRTRFNGSVRLVRRTTVAQGESPITVEAESVLEAEKALAEASLWLRSASWDRLVRALGELYLRTARKAESEGDRQRLVGLYARELSKFPGDLALDAIQRYRGTYFPALDDLRGPLEASERLLERRRRIAALEAFVRSGGREARAVPDPVRPDQHERVAAFVKRARAAMNGGGEPAWSDEQRAALDRVDQVHGERARSKSRRFKPVSEIVGAI